MYLGKTLDHFQAEEAVSNYRLAMLTGIDRGTIGRLKEGDVRPTLYTLGRIARALHIKVSDIILHAESQEENINE